jgi:hypothetical protein
MITNLPSLKSVSQIGRVNSLIVCDSFKVTSIMNVKNVNIAILEGLKSLVDFSFL